MESKKQNHNVEPISDNHSCSLRHPLPCKPLRSELGTKIVICGRPGRLASGSYFADLLSVSSPKEIFSAGQQSVAHAFLRKTLWRTASFLCEAGGSEIV